MNFSIFKQAVAAQFARMQNHQLFRVKIMGQDEKGEPVDLTKAKLWDTYLSSFQDGTNPLFRQRTEHDCSCCKQFIRAVGDVVAIIDGKVVTLWDVQTPSEPGYQPVADALAALVRSVPIADAFLHYERTAGTDKTFEQLTADEPVHTWEHFFVNIPAAYVMSGADIASKLGAIRADHDVLLRSLREITDDAVDTVLELIAQNSLYRGDEHKFAVESFRKLKQQAAGKSDADLDLFVWASIKGLPGSVAKIRNTSIGTLLVDLSNGKDMEDAVKAFEAMVAPANYKRPTALVTKAMIEKAKATIADLGLTSALERRYARLTDLTVNNILFADRSTRAALTGNVFDEMAATAGVKVKSFDKVEEVPIARFIEEILPRATSIEVLLENRHAANMVSLIAPADPTAGNLFKWGNKFSWSYAGEFADAIKERVKQAGGNVTGDLCCRLAWDYEDDLDFHMAEPGGGHIYFSVRGHLSDCGGVLDVDANGMDGIRKDPCENIVYADRNRMREGTYKLLVNNYSRRSGGAGFTVEIEHDGQVHTFAYEKALRSGQNVDVADIVYSKKDGFTVNGRLPSTTASREAWGVKTQDFRRVSAIMLSPNHWDGEGVGNRHFFFMLQGCVNDGTARGFFNEFLKEDLSQHRKVLEMVGSKLKVDESAEQLSGIGFSSTARNHLIARITGSFARTVKVVF